MFIVQLTYKAPLSEIDKYLSAHREYLDDHYKQGLFVVSGPLRPRTGGIIIAATKDRAHLEKVLAADPFSLASLAEYQIWEFIPVKSCAALQGMIQETEGNLC